MEKTAETLVSVLILPIRWLNWDNTEINRFIFPYTIDYVLKYFYRSVARIFHRKGGGGGHALSHPGYLPDWHVDIWAVFTTSGIVLDEQ